jgi:ADP-heptose:LPS heptosyltransferase
MAERKEKGWYLALPYMQGQGLRVVSNDAPDPSHAPADFIYVNGILGMAPDWEKALQDYWRMLCPGGRLILWLPDCTAMESSGHRFTPTRVMRVFAVVDGWMQRECDGIDGHIFIVLEKTAGGQKTAPWRRQEKHVLVIRSGAYGDALMAASIFPHLVEEGWSIDVLTGTAGEEALRHDPHVHAIRVLYAGQVPDEEIAYYWQAWGERYGKVINLTFSVEGELLKQPRRGDYFWSEEQRRAMCGRSYLAHTHAVSGVPGPYRVRFYANAEEDVLARKFAAAEGPFILWCLRGSAVHKWWPFVPQAVCRILAHCGGKIVLSGDTGAAAMAGDIRSAVAAYHGDASRIISAVGNTPMREIMALAPYAQLVIGPETGVLNAVSLHPVQKVVFLSHSAPANLTDDWVNAAALRPETACYPCHRLHYSHEWCPQDAATGAAACAASLTADKAVPVILRAYEKSFFRKEEAA